MLGKIESRGEPPIPVDRGILLPDEDASGEVTGGDAQPDNDDLGYAEGQSFMIEYVDSKGAGSRRRITVWGIKQGALGVPVLVAKCHERNATRSFRIDRIKAIIDYDGEVFEPPAQFLAETFGMSLGSAQKTIANTKQNRWDQIRKCVSVPARLLATLSLADGYMDPSEIKVIINYCVKQCSKNGFDLDSLEIDQLRNYVKRLRPDEATINSCLDHLHKTGIDEINGFLLACVDLVKADGVINEDEISTLNSVSKDLVGLLII